MYFPMGLCDFVLRICGKNLNFNVELRVANDASFRPEIPKGAKAIGGETIELLKRCLNEKTVSRPSFEEILAGFQNLHH